MDAKQVIGLILQLIAFKYPTPTGVVLIARDFLTALQNSPEMLAVILKLFTRQPAIPGGALGEVHIDPNDPDIQAAWKASPMLHRWAKDHGGQHPDGTEAIGLGGLATLIKFLPTLMALLPQIQQLMPLIQQFIDLFKNLQPATPTT